MGMIRRNGPASRNWHSGHALQLFSGHDFFHDAWGDPRDYAYDSPERLSWPDAETLADMAAAWEAVQAGRLEGLKDYPFDSPKCFAYRVFELGETPLQALANRRTQ